MLIKNIGHTYRYDFILLGLDGRVFYIYALGQIQTHLTTSGPDRRVSGLVLCCIRKNPGLKLSVKNITELLLLLQKRPELVFLVSL